MAYKNAQTCLAPNRIVERLSEALVGLGEQQQSNAVLEFPPCSVKIKMSAIAIDFPNYETITDQCILKDPGESRIPIWNVVHFPC